MDLKKLMSYSFNDIKDKLGDKITGVFESTRTIVIENSKEDLGYFPLSDLIMIFSPSGEMVLCTERIKIKRYGVIRYLKYKKIAYTLTDNSDSEMKVAVTKGNNFLDITRYKQWWHEWALSLAEPIDF